MAALIKSTLATDLINDRIKTTPNVDKGAISDGYHTFNELYEHRNLLFISMCRLAHESAIASPWRSLANSDGSVWEGWFVAGIGNSVTYHMPVELWDLCGFMETLEKGKWDGHTSADVLFRLKQQLSQ